MKTLRQLLTVLSISASLAAWAQPNYPTEAEKAIIITTDIENFIDAYNSLNNESDTTQVIQELYISKATPGLTEYISRFNLTAEAINNALQKHPEKYSNIEQFYATTPLLKTEHIQEMIRFKSVISHAMFPPTYLLVADYKGIAQASKFGQLISIERVYTTNSDKLKNTIVHELTHFQQAITMGIQRYTGMYQQPNNMLDIILREGGADFITHELVRNNPDQSVKLNNYMKNEVELWNKFNADLKNQDKDFWINVTYDDNNGGNTIQLGYGLGYKITANYYERVEDKNQALMDILKMEDVNKFLLMSDYNPSK